MENSKIGNYVIHTKAWLILGARSPYHRVSNIWIRVTKTPPRLDSHEIAVGLNISVPVKYFKRPILQATINMPDIDLDQEFEIDEKELKSAIEKETGLIVELRTVDNHDE